MSFSPDYRILEAALRNQPTPRLPLYEHNVHPIPAARVVGEDWDSLRESDNPADRDEYFRQFCGFFPRVGYDTVSFECGINAILPDGGALLGERPGPIQDRQSFEQYPWAELPDLYWARYSEDFAALARHLPPGVKAVGGVGNGLFEIVQDLVGYQQLCMVQFDDPELFGELFQKVADVMATIWAEFIRRHREHYCGMRFGDDLGFKSSTLLSPDTIRQYILPHYKRIIDMVHAADRPFILHSCGRIFDVMPDIIALGIDAKHSNEDAICDYTEWIDRYGDQIGLLGGLDMTLLEIRPADEVYEISKDRATRYRAAAKGYAFGTGNQIGKDTPPDAFEAMLRAVHDVRAAEAG